jgi:hypothetical protein
LIAKFDRSWGSSSSGSRYSVFEPPAPMIPIGMNAERAPISGLLFTCSLKSAAVSPYSCDGKKTGLPDLFAPSVLLPEK